MLWKSSIVNSVKPCDTRSSLLLADTALNLWVGREELLSQQSRSPPALSSLRRGYPTRAQKEAPSWSPATTWSKVGPSSYPSGRKKAPTSPALWCPSATLLTAAIPCCHPAVPPSGRIQKLDRSSSHQAWSSGCMSTFCAGPAERQPPHLTLNICPDQGWPKKWPQQRPYHSRWQLSANQPLQAAERMKRTTASDSGSCALMYKLAAWVTKTAASQRPGHTAGLQGWLFI